MRVDWPLRPTQHHFGSVTPGWDNIHKIIFEKQGGSAELRPAIIKLR